MKVLGKLIGGGLGFVSGGPVGAAAGLALGHALDAGWLRWRPHEGLTRIDPRSARVEFLYLWLGHLAKADGRVSENNVEAAERLMQRLGLDRDGRELAVRAFQRGRNESLDVDIEVRRFRQLADPPVEELSDMLRSLADFARKDGPMTPAERGVIERLGSALGFAREAVADRIADRSSDTTAPDLGQCYRMLGLAPSASNEELTRAWRRLLTQHHPDKLQGQGADAQTLKAAERRTRELRAAYERILTARGRSS
jgi:DnaJ like chaperone protein